MSTVNLNADQLSKAAQLAQQIEAKKPELVKLTGEVAALENELAQILGTMIPAPAAVSGRGNRGPRTPEQREAISQAQKRRWAKVRREQKLAAKGLTPSGKRRGRKPKSATVEATAPAPAPVAPTAPAAPAPAAPKAVAA